jgi:ketosteroid isomerase-like protein
MVAMSPPDDFRALVEAILAALNTRELDALPELIEPDHELHSLLSGVDCGVYVGIDGMRQWLADMDTVWEGHRVEFEDFRELSPEVAIAVVRNIGTARQSGVPLDALRAAVVTRRNGRAWRTVIYASPEEAERAASAL